MEMKSESNYMEEDGGLGWVKSLPVPSVQEMANNDSRTIPHRYIRDHKDRPLLDDKLSPTNPSKIPIIDFSLLAKRDQHELNKLQFPCQDWGFF
ncbi:hypothetical protein QN277_015856 [Acacia crassicarpa]|uniref:Uncharacterized protein n=1 Tax=Acacia crassicarpa TaxID=499986 RepID=A0AAE1JYK5_9FABA|nr:hypothetical protein QN277_015856 [Acacia crassicarpa]